MLITSTVCSHHYLPLNQLPCLRRKTSPLITSNSFVPSSQTPPRLLRMDSVLWRVYTDSPEDFSFLSCFGHEDKKIASIILRSIDPNRSERSSLGGVDSDHLA